VKQETKMTLEEYEYAHRTENLGDKLENTEKERAIARLKDFYANNIKAQFSEADWLNLLTTPTRAYKNASNLSTKFPLLLGMLRPYSTVLTNEMLASYGYVVAMIQLFPQPRLDAIEYMRSYPDQVFDLQIVMNYLIKLGIVEASQVGAFGFSGAGFAQMLWAMNDSRVKAFADIESAIYAEGFWERFSVSNLYDANKMKIPFLHLYGKDLSEGEKRISEFEKKKYAERFYVKFNQAKLHHWDFATEGYTSAVILKGRSELNEGVKQTFELANIYLLQFFNAYLKKDEVAKNYFTQKAQPQSYSPDLYSITHYPAIKPAPNTDDFMLVVEKKGFAEGLKILYETASIDPSSGILDGRNLNGLGYNFLRAKKIEEAIEIFKFNIKLHNNDPNFYDSLGEAYQLSGKYKEEMKKISEKVLELLPNDKINNEELKKGLKKQAEERIKLASH
jgi:dienelactone hydrolase